MISRFPALSLIFSLLLGGCGLELTAGGQSEAEVAAVATDGSTASPSQTRYSLTGEEGERRMSNSLSAGSVDFLATVSLLDDAGNAVAITNGAIAAQVTLGATARVPLGFNRVRVRRYTGIRLTFSEVAAQVAGLPIGSGSFTGVVEVDMGGSPLVVDLPMEVDVRRNREHILVLHLNSSAWLPLAQVVSLIPPRALLSASAFGQAIEVTVE